MGMCGSRKYSYFPCGILLEILNGRGASSVKLLHWKYEGKVEFPKWWVVQTKNPSMGGEGEYFLEEHNWGLDTKANAP